VSLKQTGIKLDLTGMKEFEQSVLRDLDAVVKGRQNAKCLAEFCRVQGHAWTPSPADRQTLFYKQLQLAPLREASEKTGNISVDADSMDHLLTQVPEGSETWQLIDGLRKEAHLQKLLGTYIKGLVSLVDGRGLLHPSFNLHSTVTYRSSSSGPNFQNIPVRNPVLSRVRKYMVPQNDYFLECDISGSELRWISHTTRCKKMIDQVNADVNIHRFWAHRLFQICEVDITKTQRATAKTYAVFPWCYGDYWKNVAANCGIDQSHAQAVEAEFFSPDYYKDVRRWQDNLVTEYNEKGYVQSELGFRMRGPMKRTEIYNGLIQGISFHKVLDVLVKVARDMEGGNYKSTIPGQIHDSIVFDVVDSEAADLMKMTNGYMETPSWGWDNRIRIKCEWKAGLNFLETDAVQ
jgi:DNA polymerase-1